MDETREQLIYRLTDRWRLLTLEEFDENDQSPEDYREDLEQMSLEELKWLDLA